MAFTAFACLTLPIDISAPPYDASPGQESIYASSHPQEQLSAVKQTTKIRIIANDEDDPLATGLPEYIGTFSGSVVAFAFLLTNSNAFIAYYKLTGLILFIGASIGFLLSYSTFVRLKELKASKTPHHSTLL